MDKAKKVYVCEVTKLIYRLDNYFNEWLYDEETDIIALEDRTKVLQYLAKCKRSENCTIPASAGPDSGPFFQYKFGVIREVLISSESAVADKEWKSTAEWRRHIADCESEAYSIEDERNAKSEEDTNQLGNWQK